jgi:hypothetical protein
MGILNPELDFPRAKMVPQHQLPLVRGRCPHGHQLSTLIEVSEEEENAKYIERWLTAGSNPELLASSSVTLLSADSDRYEQ